MSFRRVDSNRISPPTAAARVGDPAVMWEAIVDGYFSHSEIVVGCTPMHSTAATWGASVWVRNVSTGNVSTPIRVRFPNPHVTIMWAPASEFSAGDLIQIMAEPLAETAAMSVDRCVITMATQAIPSTQTPDDPEYAAPPPGWGEAQWGIDTWQEA